MAEIIADRVKQLSTTTGTGDFAVTASIPGFKMFSEVCTAGDTFHGCIVAVDAQGNPTGQWEAGLFTYKSTGIIERTTVRASSATSNAKVVFGAGNKHVYIDLLSYQIRNFRTTGSQTPSARPLVPAAEDAQYGALTFADDFSGTLLDTTKWSTAEWNMHGVVDPTQNYNVSNGFLNIWPQRNGAGQWFDRSITTRTKFSQRYGFFEFQFQAPIGAGLYVDCGMANDVNEIFKIAHMYSGAPVGNWSNTALHAIDAAFVAETDFMSPNNQSVAFYRALNLYTPPDFSVAQHTFGVRWDATTLRFYIDGVQRGNTVSHTQFQDAMFLFVGLSLVTDNEYPPLAGTGTPSTSNPITPEGIANALKINHVRAWQLA